MHGVRTKRANLVLREDLLEEAVRVSGERTYSRTVELALESYIDRAKAAQIRQLAGSGAWTGSLAEMRRDAGVSSAPVARRRPRVAR